MSRNTNKNRIAVVGLAHPYEEGYQEAPLLLAKTLSALKSVGASCLDTGIVLEDLSTVKKAVNTLKGEDFDSLLVCIATWSEDHHLFDLLADIHVPIILRAFPAFNTGSLCCAHQICCVLTEIETPYTYIYGNPDDIIAAEKALSASTVSTLTSTLRKLKVGNIGGRANGMTEIACDEFGLMNKLGSRIVNIDETELIEAVSSISDSEAALEWNALKLEQRGCHILSSPDDVSEAVKYYLAMKSLVHQYDLGALAVKCYTKYMGKVCLGYSLLAEEGIACSCEGDVPNAITMKMLQVLSGKPINNTDLLYPDSKDNTILFAHCGSSGISIADGTVELAPVRLANVGVCTRFIPKTGVVTLVNLCGHGEKLRMTVMTGEAVATEMTFAGNPAKVTFERPVLEICEEIAKIGAGHHWMIAYGDYSDMLEKYCKNQNVIYFRI